MINKKNVLALAAFVIGSFAFAQSSSPDESNTLKNLSVSATVVASGDPIGDNSMLEIIRPTVTNGIRSINFNDGNNLSTVNDQHRFTSSVVELSYFVESGITAWDLIICTTDEKGSIGLLKEKENDEEEVKSIPLKFSLVGADETPLDVGDDANWSGDNAAYTFVTDRGDSQTVSDSVSRLTSSTEVESVGYNPSLKFVFGTDIAAAVAGTYSATITIELFIQ